MMELEDELKRNAESDLMNGIEDAGYAEAYVPLGPVTANDFLTIPIQHELNRFEDKPTLVAGLIDDIEEGQEWPERLEAFLNITEIAFSDLNVTPKGIEVKGEVTDKQVVVCIPVGSIQLGEAVFLTYFAIIGRYAGTSSNVLKIKGVEVAQ